MPEIHLFRCFFSCCLRWILHSTPQYTTQTQKRIVISEFIFIHSFIFILSSSIHTLRVYISIHFWHTFSIQAHAPHHNNTYDRSLARTVLLPFSEHLLEMERRAHTHKNTTQPSSNRHEKCSKKSFFLWFDSIFCYLFQIKFTAWPVTQAAVGKWQAKTNWRIRCVFRNNYNDSFVFIPLNSVEFNKCLKKKPKCCAVCVWCVRPCMACMHTRSFFQFFRQIRWS